MKKVVILASGMATRLKPITSHMPKVLVNYKQHTILKHLYDIYANQLGADEIIVVVNSCYKEMVKAYAAQENLNIKILTVDEALGSAYALCSISGHLYGHNVVLNWCDVIPQFNNFEWDMNSVYTWGNDCRFHFDRKFINKGVTGGNVLGVYQVQQWDYMPDTKENLNEMCQGKDFVEFVSQELDVFQEHKLSNAVDLGDMIKLAISHKDQEFNREFNKIEFNYEAESGLSFVTKIATNEMGLALQERELAWYKNVTSKNVPKILDVAKDRFDMELLQGKTMFEHSDALSPIDLTQTVKSILSAMNFSQASSNVPLDSVKRDFKYEIVEKVLGRNALIQGLIDSFGEVTHVNGVKLGRVKTLLNQAYNHLLYQHTSSQEKYRVIHGDPHFSNIIIGKDIKFIDPRGYFGKTIGYGPRIYDESKVLYSLEGYDDFNANPTWGGLSIDNGYATIDIKKPKTKGRLPFNDYHYLWVAIIWIALGGYFKNNPLKAVSAYYYGLYLLTIQLDKMGRRLNTGLVSHDGPLVKATLVTKNPGKWVLTDLETGVQYRPIGGHIDHQWEKL
ncbi:hypothetical protein TH1_060 [Shewanella phage Thanatos-1]|nr:hypothetical protein TH1_060 [Shewanella phage Thanatos-1]